MGGGRSIAAVSPLLSMITSSSSVDLTAAAQGSIGIPNVRNRSRARSSSSNSSEGGTPGVIEIVANACGMIHLPRPLTCSVRK